MILDYKTNAVKLVGVVAEELTVSHDYKGEVFYKTTVATDRLSGVIDYVPVIVSEKLLKGYDYTGCKVKIEGEFRSTNRVLDGKNRLILNVFANSFDYADPNERHASDIELRGFVCKLGNYRETPSRRALKDLMVAVPRTFKKSDYLPLLSWGRDAQFVDEEISLGDEIRVTGRIQSRSYKKTIDEKTSREVVVYEVSIKTIEVLGD